MSDVAFAGQQAIDLLLVDVEAHCVKPGLDESLNQRDSHVAQSDHADFRRFLVNRFFQHLFTLGVSCQ